MKNGKQRENKPNTICPLLAMPGFEDPHCKGAKCEWWTDNEYAIESISEYLQSLAKGQR